MHSDIKVGFKGFIPMHDLKSSVSSAFTRVLEMAPSDSIIHGVIEKSEKLFHGSIRVASGVGTFVAKAVTDDPRHLPKMLAKEVASQMDNWKKVRFQDVRG